MIAPGRYRHFKGSHYQVLLTASWEQTSGVGPCVYVVAFGAGDPPAAVLRVQGDEPSVNSDDVLAELERREGISGIDEKAARK